MADEIPLEPKFAVARCDCCRNGIEFDLVQLAGRPTCKIQCPHCGQETNLREPPPPPPLIPDEGWNQPIAPEPPLAPEPGKNISAQIESILPPPVSTPMMSKPVEEISSVDSPTALVPKPIMVSLPPEPLPPTHTRAPVDVRWLTDLGVVYFRQHQFGEAFLCFSRAAQQGFATAQFCLSVCFFNGHGVARDETAALSWLRAAVAQGDANAEFTLGLAYSLGRGVAPDAAQAANWLKQAATHGHAEAIRRARELTVPLPAASPAEISSDKNSTSSTVPVGSLPLEKNSEKRRHDLQRLVLGLFKRK